MIGTNVEQPEQHIRFNYINVLLNRWSGNYVKIAFDSGSDFDFHFDCDCHDEDAWCLNSQRRHQSLCTIWSRVWMRWARWFFALNASSAWVRATYHFIQDICPILPVIWRWYFWHLESNARVSWWIRLQHFYAWSAPNKNLIRLQGASVRC